MNHTGSIDDDCINVGLLKYSQYHESYFDEEDGIISIKYTPNITSYSRFFSRAYHEMLSFDKRFNISYVLYTGYTQRLLEKNKIDYFADIEELEGHPPMYIYPRSPKLVLATYYDCSLETSLAQQRQKDFGECVLAFDSETWLITYILFCIISCLISLHLKWNKNNDSGSWMSFRHVVNQVNFVDINYRSRILGLLADLFVFLIVICYFGNMITSDKVTKYVPDVYQHYKQVPKDGNVTVYFSDAWKDSLIRNETRNKMLEFYQNSNVKFEDVSFIELNSKLFGKLEKGETRLFVEFNENIKQTRCAGCPYVYTNDVCVYVGKDSLDTDVLLMGFPRTPFFATKKIFPKYNKFFTRSMETGLLIFQRNQIFPVDCGITHDTANCFSESVVTHDPELSPFDLSNYEYCLTALSIPFTLAVIRLIQELWSYKKTVTTVRPFSAH